ncbi:MAG: helix-turn-helix domain-containing protein [Planctomycetaceae bacterium]|nr:helix-turn-helix domain-containing protein [Planctomycetales bacterium]MCB9923955.1 helix-turn-helix domain-containing protein [Planctomycetaceae bacterium]
MARQVVWLNEVEAERVQRVRSHGDGVRVRQWADILWLLHNGICLRELMRIAGTSRRTVERCRRRWQQEGLDGLFEDRHYRPQSELDQFREVVKAAFDDQPPRSVAEAVERIEQLTGVRRSSEPVRLFLRRLGMSFRQVAAIPMPPQKMSRNMLPISNSFWTSNSSQC